MSGFKKLASDTALYGVSTILGRLLNWALVPLHTYIFSQPQALSSNVELYNAIGTLLILYTLGLETAFFRYAARNRNQLEVYFSRSLSIVLVVTALFTIPAIVFSGDIARALEYTGQQKFIRWAALILAIDAVTALPFARLRVENKARRFVTAKILNVLIVIALNLFFLIFCRDVYNGEYLTFLQPFVDLIYDPTLGPGYIFLANLIANACYFLLIRNAFKGFRFQWDNQQVQTLLLYAFPMMLTNLVGNINMSTDRYFLRHFLPEGFYPGLSSKDALGIYGNCYKLSVFITLAINSFRFAADPFFFSRAEDKNAPDLLANVTKWFVIVCVMIWVGVSLNLDAIGLLIGENYRSGLPVVPVLMLANLMLGIFYNLAFWFKLTDKTSYGTLITVIGTVVTILLNILLIPVLGYMGCAVAFLASSVVMTVICYYLGEKHYPVPYNVPSALGYLLSGGLLIYFATQIRIGNLWLALLYHQVLFGLYLAAMLVIERDTFGPLLAKWRSGRRPAGVEEKI
ncbi:lipopolysaccharide biosynthesis protein [Larkinella soli]|uniref:lipopolysaccharide biosynthesis protein n=1 Tax=Larkinella soli TaxID=1770527 RepID=UPI000FFB7D91|nr:polysaccharide biosynthesis C-terminal domain-containing protein [Larkinella soli]